MTTLFSEERAASHDREIVGPILSLDLGTRRVGAAVSDPTLIAITRIEAIIRSNWKQLLLDVSELIRRFDAKTMVIGFPLNLDGNEGDAASAARAVAVKFARSLNLPVYLQDERLTSREAEERLRADGYSSKEIAAHVDSESAAVILRDFLVDGQHRILIQRPLE
ncbi:MAG: Holliday junction resolvase YqgF [Acidobacteria bacterium]|nr:Holliday junction resolvase YqgF [Acidobacteriota bacterium]